LVCGTVIKSLTQTYDEDGNRDAGMETMNDCVKLKRTIKCLYCLKVRRDLKLSNDEQSIILVKAKEK